MKKLITYLSTIVLFFNFVSVVFAGNAMTTDSYSFTVQTLAQADTQPPQIVSQSPLPNAINIGRMDSVIYELTDDLAGVNWNTIDMKINGISVTTVKTGTILDTTVTYIPITPFDYGEFVYVTLDAEDLAD